MKKSGRLGRTATKVLSAVFSAVIVFSSLGIGVYGGGLSLSAGSAILISADDCTVLYEKDAYRKRSMASTTKIMTALIAIEGYDLDKTVTVSKEAVGVEGSSIYLYENEKLTMKELVLALMLESANDAATAIAVEVAGDVPAFADMMNEKAREIGLYNTSFENPHGLDSEDHYTTAYDLARLASYAMKNKTFREMVSTPKASIPMKNGEGTRVLINHNRLLRSYEGAVGVKTGFTKKSGRCLVSAAERDGVMLIAVTLSAPDDWNDHKKMLDYGFSVTERVTMDSISGSIPVVGGASEAVGYYGKPASFVIPSGEHNIKTVIEMSRFYYAPIEEGEVLGRAVFYDGNTEIGYTEIKASYSVEKRSEKRSFWKFLRSLFK